MNIYQHFRPEEREFIDQVIKWKSMVEDSYVAKLTDFLDPRAQQIVHTIIGDSTDLNCHFFGGVENAERKRVLIAPPYQIVSNEDYQIELIEVEYPRKFFSIEHREVLGSLMSLGLKRDKFGDILMENGNIQFIVAKEIKAYLQGQLTSIGRAKVSLKDIPLTRAISTLTEWEEMDTTITSMRLDAVIAALFKISRQRSQQLIEQGVVKVNFTPTLKTSFEIKEFDLISVRGFGRIKILSIDGKTKKDKWRITIGKQK